LIEVMPQINRRTFLAGAAATLLAAPSRAQQQTKRPNILWIVSEDNNPYLGCYGDKLARTPTLDNLAKQGILYENAFSQAPVCAPSRFTIITGLYATSCAPANHMRASGHLPKGVRGFPAYLRDAGYYNSNNAKTDYNAPIAMKDTWDESSKQAHWRKRRRPDQPFFAVFNHEVTHESSIFGKYPPLENGTDPAAVRIPAYSPDTPETRRDRALYYDNMARLDDEVAMLLAQLQADGLADDTIVFYYGDNGGVLPRSKRFCYDSGLHVPLIVRFPQKWQHLAPAPPGSRIEAPISQVDYAPTVLSLAGVAPPDYFQGHAFLGPKAAPPQQYACSFRDRMDERYDMVRTARDQRFRYIRNYMPHLPWGQHVQYLWQQQGMKVWERLYKEGKLNEVQRRFWEEKPEEELYDLTTDPDEVRNLATSPDHREIVARMRAALRKHMQGTRDQGFIPEGSPIETDPAQYPLERLLDLADLATNRDPANLPRLTALMNDENECIRYWATLGCLMLKEKSGPAKDALTARLKDASPHVQVVAAEALADVAALTKLLAHENIRIRLQAINALGRLGGKAKPALPAIQKARQDKDDYVKRAARYTAAVLRNEEPPGEGDQ
jgi:arylsulfatase A-like enzyme